MSDARQPEVAFFHFLTVVSRKFSFFSITVKKLRNTNFISSRHVKRENTSLPVDVRRSKTSLLKLPVIKEQNIQWRIQGRGPRGSGSPLPPSYLRGWMIPPPPPLSESLDPSLIFPLF